MRLKLNNLSKNEFIDWLNDEIENAMGHYERKNKMQTNK